MEIQFYHLTSTRLEQALPKLLEKAQSGGFRSLVKLADRAAMQRLDEWLWTYDQDSFLAHGRADEAEAERQPALLSTELEPRNGATLLLVADGSIVPEAAAEQGIARVLDLFDGADDGAVQAARQRWQHYKERGLGLSYLRQQPNGGWKKEA